MVQHSSRIELSLSALRNNYRFIRKKCGERPIISAVVKANAYGHGFAEFIPMAERCGIRHFSVASSHEASQVLEVCASDSRIMIMGILYPVDLSWVLENGVEFYVFDLARLQEVTGVARGLGRTALIHLELETGGNRTGLPEADLTEAFSVLKNNRKHLHLRGICSHLAGIETLANQFRINRQLERFEKLSKRFDGARIKPDLRHIACSAAAMGFPVTTMDLVRVGTALYGMWPSPDIQNLHLLESSSSKNDRGLQRVMSWKTDVMHLKQIKADDFVGYGTSFQAPHDMQVAVLPIGYSNGFPRGLSNRGHVLIRGRRCPVVGLVNMNACMVDVTQVPNVRVGDEVVLVGKQKNNTISIRSFSEFTNALNNEFISRLPAAIPRMPTK